MGEEGEYRKTVRSLTDPNWRVGEVFSVINLPRESQPTAYSFAKR
jgi:hypothetical protein